jgi:N-acetylglucosaminyl-diphospho-decaprenol L-rhamnosyltransferase
VIVVDNASTDDSIGSVADLPVQAVRRSTNGGFATGCNAGWRVGSAPFVLFLNPDATIDESSLRALVAVLQEDEGIGAAAPRIEYPDGSVAFSQRRFPTLRSTYAQAFFLHRILQRAPWSDELIRDPEEYERPRSPDWVSGACLLLRRSTLEQLDGWDEDYFLYCEDVDICRRIRRMGLAIRFDPAAVAVHREGQSAPSTTTIPLLAASKVRYAANNRSRRAALIARVGVALGALTHLIVSRDGFAARLAHARAFHVVISRQPKPRPAKP